MPLAFLERIGRQSSSSTTATLSSASVLTSSKVIAVRKNSPPAFIPSRNFLDWSITLTEIAGDVSNMLQSTPAAAAAALLTAVLKTIAAVKVNQERCMRIGERATRALESIGVQMDRKWDTAPQSLLKNLYTLESTLSGIQDCMRRVSQVTWRRRLLSKPQIDDMLQQCESRLDEAMQGFQLTSLMQIHYAVGSRLDYGVSNGDIANCVSSEVAVSSDESDHLMSDADELEEFFATLRHPEDVFGFRRYHPSEVVLSKSLTWRSGWFSELSEANVKGVKMIVKGYTASSRDEALRSWYQDIKRLRNIYHPRFPQLLGYSSGKAQTPFIILSCAPKQDVMSYLRTSLTPEIPLAESVLAFLRAYRDISRAVLYAQQQLSLDSQGMKEFIRNATYAVNHSHSLVLGLPVQIDDNVVARRWTEVVGDAFLPKTIVYHYLTFLERTCSLSPHNLRSSVIESMCLLDDLMAYDSPDVRLHEELDCALDRGDAMSLMQLRKIAYGQAGRTSYHTRTYLTPLAFNDIALGDIGIGIFEGPFFSAGNIFNLEPDAHSSLEVEIRDEVLQSQPGSEHPASDSWIILGMMNFFVVNLEDNERAPLHSRYISSLNNAWNYLIKWARPLAQAIGVDPSLLMMVVSLGGPQPTTEEPLDVVLVPVFQAGFLQVQPDDFVETGKLLQ
ncbi:hypothetical protein FA95DRAFT_1602228 [Auriscalpium vulgare]|uniref:Uncharacterized protein n=1 Tax=Auriscalpium vulgare TaxID=40419 RepID=A0ACB8S680_9AGAM|nr:hypothetical protein FA95DRAFT_1602228 [Auriscalpium vulgare]